MRNRTKDTQEYKIIVIEGKEFVCVKYSGKYYVGIYRVCKNLGLSDDQAKAQMKAVRKNQRLKHHVIRENIKNKRGSIQKTWLIDIKFISAWLLGAKILHKRPDFEEYVMKLSHSLMNNTQVTNAIDSIKVDLETDIIRLRGTDIVITSNTIAELFTTDHLLIKKLIGNYLKNNNNKDLASKKIIIKNAFYELTQEGVLMFMFDLMTFKKEENEQLKTVLEYILNEFEKVNEYFRKRAYSSSIEDFIPQKNSNRSQVYLFKNPLNDYIKVGVSSNVERRKSELEVAGIELELIFVTPVISNAYEIEAGIHRVFKDKHVGREWFNILAYDLIEFIESKELVLETEI